MLIASVLIVSACLKPDTLCTDQSDCFVGEHCTDGRCTSPPTVIGGSAAPTSPVGAFEDGRTYRLALDARDEPHVFVLTKAGTLLHAYWDGFAWQTATIAERLILDELSGLEAVHDDEAGFVVLVNEATHVSMYQSANGDAFAPVEIRDAPVFAPALTANMGLTAICGFDGDLSEIDNLTPFVLIRDRSGEWKEFEFGEAATPYCNVAISPRGVLTVAFSRYNDDLGEQLHFAQSIAAPLDAVDLTLTATQRTGRLPSQRSLAVNEGVPVLLHAERGIGNETLFLSRVLDLDRHSTRSVRSVSDGRFINSADLFIDPLDDRRVVFTTSDFTFAGSDPAGYIGELVGDRIHVEPLERALQSIEIAFGSDGVLRAVTWSEEDGLQFRIGL